MCDNQSPKFEIVDSVGLFETDDFMTYYEKSVNNEIPPSIEEQTEKSVKNKDAQIPPSIQNETKSNMHVSSSSESIEHEILKYVKSHKPKVRILTPLYGGACQVGYVQSLISTIELFRLNGISLCIEFCKNDSLVTRARNNLIAKAMNDPETTHMMFIDGDISWSPIDILKLLIADKALCGGCYPLKRYNFADLLVDPLKPDKTNIVQDIVSRKQNTFFKDTVSDESMLRYNLVKYNLNHLSEKLEVNRNLAKVRHIATGFMMIQRELIETMIEAYPSSRYTDDVGFVPSNIKCYNLFNCSIEEGHLLSEDWYFCSNWTKLGGDIFVDVSINLTHTGTEDFQGSYLASILG
jgi:hypothetical protein